MHETIQIAPNLQISANRTRNSAASQHNAERRLYIGAALAIALLVFCAFARSYYLKMAFHTPALAAPVHIHGLVMTGWVAIFLIQVLLIVARRVEWHRRLGEIGAAWAVMVTMMGSMTTLRAAAREVSAHSVSADGQVIVLGLELTQMLLFAAFTGLAIWWRRRAGVHKRLMLLASVCLLPSAFARLPQAPFGLTANQSILLMLNVFVAVCIVIDTLRNRRLHPAFGWGALVLLGFINLMFIGVHSRTWLDFGTWLVS